LLHRRDHANASLQQPYVTRHAIERYQQRVSDVAPAEAARRLAELAADSTRRPTPRWWTNVPPGPGVLFLYHRANSGICLLMKAPEAIEDADVWPILGEMLSGDELGAWLVDRIMKSNKRSVGYPRLPYSSTVTNTSTRWSTRHEKSFPSGTFPSW